jgi:ketosteroid isomerase-like protein
MFSQKQFKFAATAVLMFCCTACTQAPPAPDPKALAAKAAEATAKDVADIKAVADRFLKALLTKDVNAMMAFYVSDESLFVFDVTPPRQYIGAAAYRKDWEDLLGLFPGPITATTTDIDVTAGGGDLAWAHSIQHVAGTMKNGKKLDLTVRITDGYKRVNGQWLIAHEHVSVPVDVLTGKADLTSKP